MCRQQFNILKHLQTTRWRCYDMIRSTKGTASTNTTARRQHSSQLANTTAPPKHRKSNARLQFKLQQFHQNMQLLTLILAEATHSFCLENKSLNLAYFSPEANHAIFVFSLFFSAPPFGRFVPRLIFFYLGGGQ